MSFASRQLYWDHKTLNPSTSLGIQSLCPQKCIWQEASRNRARKTVKTFSLNPERPRILQQAVSEGRLQQVCLLLNAGVNANGKDSETGETALIRTAFLENGKLRRRAARMLLKFGAKVKNKDILGRSALSWACLAGREDLVKLFLSQPEYEADLGSIDLEGNTNLILACMSGNSTVVRVLVDAFRRNKFDVNRRNVRGESALALAYSRKFYDCAKIVLSDGQAVPLKKEQSLSRPNSLSPAGPDPRTPHESQRQKTCNLPQLFSLYTVQLTHSYPTKPLRIPVVTFKIDHQAKSC